MSSSARPRSSSPSMYLRLARPVSMRLALPASGPSSAKPLPRMENAKPSRAAHSDTGANAVSGDGCEKAGAGALGCFANAFLILSNMKRLVYLQLRLSKQTSTMGAKTMINVYSWATPNGHKVHIMLEECGLSYEAIPVDIGRGDQFKPDFLAISPNNKIPATTDPDGPDGRPISLF